MRLLLIVVPLVASLASSALADYVAGLSAAERGDYATALSEWLTLAEQGDSRAQTHVGFMYAGGHGTARDDAVAVRWYRRAASEGYARAQFNLGYMYANGRGTEQDQSKAALWYRRAAEQDFPPAQFNLGRQYALAEDSPQETGEAYFWFAIAAARGHRRATAPRDELARELDADTRSLLDGRVRDWLWNGDEAVAEQPDERSQDASVQAAIEARGPAVVAPPATPVMAPPPEARIQLASLRSHDDALREWRRLQRIHSDVIGDLEPSVVRAELNGRAFYRLQVGPLASPARANDLCARLARRKAACLIVEPESPN